MHIVLLILKIIMWIILGLLGLSILLLLLLLFAPIHYKANVKYKDKANIRVKVRFLIISVLVMFDQETKQADTVTRICGIKFKRRRKKEPEVTEADVQKELAEHGESYDEFAAAEIPLIETPDSMQAGADETQTANAAQNAPDMQTADTTQSADTSQAEEGAGNWAQNFAQDVIANKPQTVEDSVSAVTYGEPEVQEVNEDSSELLDNLQDIDEEHEKKVSFISNIIAKLIGLFEKITGKAVAFSGWLWDKADEVSDKADAALVKADAKYVKLDRTIQRIEKFFELPYTEKTKDYLSKYVPGVLKHIAPRKAKGYIHYGMAEPYKTGTVTGYLSVLPFMHQKSLAVIPDFHEKVMDIDLQMKGHIILGYVLRIALNLNVWKTIKAARKINE